MSLLLQRMGAKKPTVFTPPDTLAQQSSTSTTIQMSWSNHGSHPTEIWRNGTLVTTVTAGQSSYTDTGLNNATVYNYMIRYRSGTAYSPFSVNVAMATSLPTPTGLSAGVSVRTVNLSWTNTTTLAAIEVWMDSGSGYAFVNTVAAGSVAATVGGLADGTYHFKIRYSVSGTTGAFSSVSDATVAATVNAPTSPSATAHSGSGTQIDLAWTLGTAGAQTEIYRGTSSNPTTLVATTSAGDTTYSDTGLSPNTTYHYRLKGLHDTVESSYTSDFSATTHTPPSGAPTGLTADTTYTDRVSLSWTDADSGASINIYRNGSLLTNVAATTTTYNDDTVSPGTSYTYAVKHLKDSIESTASTTTANVPNNAFGSQSVSSDGVATSTCTVSWTIIAGPRSATVQITAPTNTDGDVSGTGEDPATSPASIDVGFAQQSKHPGVTHEITVSMQVKLKDHTGAVVLTDSSFMYGTYRNNDDS